MDGVELDVRDVKSLGDAFSETRLARARVPDDRRPTPDSRTHHRRRTMIVPERRLCRLRSPTRGCRSFRAVASGRYQPSVPSQPQVGRSRSLGTPSGVDHL